jgi:hypothetical protein
VTRGSSGALRDVPPARPAAMQARRDRSSGVRRRAGGALAPLLAVVALASALTAVPVLGRNTLDVARADRETWDRPELYPGDVGVPAVVVERAEREIPEDELYAVAVGDQIPVIAGGIGVVQALHYFLLPRRSTAEVWQADWVIAWGQSSETLGVPVAREIGLAPSVNLVEVRR